MRLQWLKLENFKAFREIELDLQGRDTVVVGVNGVGKSTVLSAIAHLSYSWLRRLTPVQGYTFKDLSIDEITVGAERCRISCGIDLAGEPFELERFRARPVPNERRGSQTYSRKSYDDFASAFRRLYLGPDDSGLPDDGGARDSRPVVPGAPAMPIFVHYGTNRAITTLKEKPPKEQVYDQVSALEYGSDSTLSFDRFFEWYREQEAEEAIEIREDRRYANRALEQVRHVISTMIEGVSDINVRRNPMRMTAVKDGAEIRIDQLSDGEKCTLALFGDLVRRLTLANPGLENPISGEGIVLIDEVELHMHPSWQRRILPKLRENFPNVQFIVSTHSPQVLGEVDDSYNLFFLYAGERERQRDAPPDSGDVSRQVVRVARMDGLDSNSILETYMGTPSRNGKVQALSDAVYREIDDGDFEAAGRIVEELRLLAGNLSPDYILAAGSLARARNGGDLRSNLPDFGAREFRFGRAEAL